MSFASDLEVQMLMLINAERAAVGLDPVQLELDLNEAAEDHSEWMISTDTFSHTGVGGSNPGDRMRDAGFTFANSWTWGENVAWQSIRGAAGFEDDVINLHNALMNSAGHRANILNPNFDYIGIGITVGEYDGWTGIFVTQNFARTGAEVSLDPSDPSVSPPNVAPTLVLSDTTLDEDIWAVLAPNVSYDDADDDAAITYQIREQSNTLELRLNDQDIDASDRFEFNAAFLNTLQARGTMGNTQADIEMRAFDGEDWSAWQTMTVSTQAAPQAAAAVDEPLFQPETVEDFFAHIEPTQGRFSPSFDAPDAAKFFFHTAFDFSSSFEIDQMF